MFIYSAFLFVLPSLTYSQKYFICHGSIEHTTCGIEEPGGVFRLPTNLDAGIESLAIGPAHTETHYSYEVTNSSELQKFKSLNELVIRVKIWLFSFELLQSPNTLLENLFFLENLHSLEIRGADFNTHQHSWKFPPNLLWLSLTDTKYVSLNLSGCPRLTDLDLNSNQLTKLPSFSDPLPTMRRRVMFRDNPLYTFTVNDIAGLCEAPYIQFSYSSMGSQRRRCECQRLKRWADETGTKEPDTFGKTVFNCNFKDLSSQLCKNYTLEEAYAIRNACIQRTGGSSIILRLLLVGFIYLLMMIGGLVCLVVGYKLTKSKRQIENPYEQQWQSTGDQNEETIQSEMTPSVESIKGPPSN